MNGSGVRFDVLTGEHGFRIFDPIERRAQTFRSDRELDLSPCGTDRFDAPVDTAVTIDPGRLHFDVAQGLYVRKDGGALHSLVEFSTSERFPTDSYAVELPLPIKVYVEVEGPFSVDIDEEGTTLDLTTADHVSIGARSFHKHPAGTVQTTTDPEALMRAVSLLGSALKTHAPERAFPTLRGHPPLIEVGEAVDVPDHLAPPETGVEIEVPRDHRYILEAAPLAFYLGASLRPGETPQIVTDVGFHYPLPDGKSFFDAVSKTLKQVFFLDCLIRTEGYYQIRLHERERLDSSLDLDFESLYDRSIPSQLATYLQVPFETIRPHLPRWKSTVFLESTPEMVAALPFAVNELALVRVGGTERSGDGSRRSPVSTEIGGQMASSARLESFGEPGEPVIDLEESDALGAAWYGNGIAVGANKALVQANLNRLERTPTDGPISIVVVSNAPEMAYEATTDSIYGGPDEFPFEVTVREQLSRAELGAVLQEDHEFLHYIGHVDEQGLLCTDGRLDVNDLDSVGIDAFLLNACQSYTQGRALIERGAIGGVVTVNDVVNFEAVVVGRTLARLLDAGFPLNAALTVAGAETVIGDLYLVLGDGELTIAQSESGIALVGELQTTGQAIDAKLHSYPTTDMGMGSLVFPHLEDQETHHLVSGTIDLGTVDRSDLESFLDLENMPVRVDGTLYWGQDTDFDDIL